MKTDTTETSKKGTSSDNEKIIITDQIVRFEKIKVIQFSPKIDKIIFDKIISPIEKIVGGITKKTDIEYLNDKIYTESVKYYIQGSQTHNFLFQKFVSPDFVNKVVGIDIYYDLSYRYGNKYGETTDLYLSFGYSDYKKNKLKNSVEFKSLLKERVKEKRKVSREKLKEKKLEEQRLKELEEQKLLKKKIRLNSVPKTTILKENLYHISILEPIHGEHYCSQYIINERLFQLMNENIGNGYETFGDGVDITGNYGFINYKISKKNIKVLSKDRVVLEKQFKKQLTNLKYTKTDFLTDEKIIIISLEKGRDYFEDVIGYCIEESIDI